MAARGDRLVVPYRPQAGERGTGAAEVSLRCTAAVRVAVEAAAGPIRVEDLAAKIRSEFPAAPPPKVTAMLTELVARGALITSLHAPGTEPDAMGHLVKELDAAGASGTPAAGLAAGLKEIRALLERHNRAPASESRADAAALMRRLAPVSKHPLALDLRLDVTVVLPREVAREAERAALALARLAVCPAGPSAWKTYRQRFYERYGAGALVPLLDVVADSGIGWPDGYPGTLTPAPRPAVPERDEALLAIAQGAALDGAVEVPLDEGLIAALELRGGRLRLPPHLELGVRVRAASRQALQDGDFLLEVMAVSRAAGVLSGRFLNVLRGEDRAALAAGLSALPANDDSAVTAQLSFPPLDAVTTHVTRTPQVLPMLVSMAEHRPPGGQVLTPADLAVGCDGRRMYLAAPGLGLRVEAAGMHALNLIVHTPPLARFVTELSRAQCAQVTVFDWGAAAHLPFQPRLRHGRVILSPARWRLDAAALPGPAAAHGEWDDALDAWRERRRVPSLVHLTEDDRHLPLDLGQGGHRALLRAHLRAAPRAVLTVAPGPGDAGWCGERPHEIIVALTATAPPPWPRLPAPCPERVTHGEGHAPAASTTLLACLYGDIHRQDTILAEHLPALLARLGQPAWWYIRYRDPGQHLRLRVTLPGAAAFGEAASTISTWFDELRQARLLSDVRYPTSYPETGRWGSGPAMRAAEAVFAADSRAVLAQLTQPARPSRQALVAAHAVAIAIAFTGSTAAGMGWLTGHVPAAAPARIPRPVYAEAVRIADPGGGWAALRAAQGGAAIVDAWADRDQAIAAYRACLPGPGTRGIDPDDVLNSILHLHYVRAVAIDFPDEAECMHLARAAALSWTARSSGGRG